jgi:tetratricopeptide (TPR) repeat protein
MKENRGLFKKRICVTLIVFIFLLAGRGSFAQKDFYMDEKKLYEKYKISIKSFEKGRQYYSRGNYKKAEKEMKKCLEIFPKHHNAHFFLSIIILRKGDSDQALKHIEEAKANFEFMNKMFAFAYQEYQSKLRKQKDDAKSRLQDYQGQLSTSASDEDKRKYEQAISSFENEISIINSRLTEPVPRTDEIPGNYFFIHGNILFKLKKFAESQKQYLLAIKMNPGHGDAYNNLANLYYMGKQYQKALDCLNHAEANGVKTNPKLKKAILKAIKK